MPPAEQRFANKHVAVTGAGRGIGRSLALAFAREGASLSIFSRTAAELEEVAAGVRAAGGRAHPSPCDVTDGSQVNEAMASARRELGPVEALVNNAGMFLWKPFLESTPEEWGRVFATNLTSAFH